MEMTIQAPVSGKRRRDKLQSQSVGGVNNDGAGEDARTPPSPEIDIRKACALPNICEMLDDEYINWLGNDCYEGYMSDLQSRAAWDDKQDSAMKLAMQITERKTFPWTGASNVKFPLVTIAAMQYHSRAYPALVNADDIVRYKVYGPDDDGQKDKVGKLIGAHMTYQLTEEDRGWEEGMDLALLVQPIVGCVFKKTYYEPARKLNVSEPVLPRDLVVHYYIKNLEEAERITHVMQMNRNKVHFNQVKGFFRDMTLPAPIATPSPENKQEATKQRSQGVSPPIADPQMPYTLLEQHRWIDLDGDGYAEPYVVTLDRDSRQVLRVVARFAETDIEMVVPPGKKVAEVARINAECYFTKYPFIPSPDGGFYDMGFGSLLSPLNHSIDSLINQLVDAGTLANTAGGFLGRGIKLRAGQQLFKPFGWNPIDTVGDDIGKNIFPLPVRQPSDVLFKLLGFMVQYGERICGAVDINTGVTPDQNTPAETTRAAGESGMKVLSAIFKRTWRAEREEFRQIYKLNRRYLDEMKPNPFGVKAATYALDPLGIRPSADPTLTSDAARMAQAKMGIELLAVKGAGLKPWEAARRLLVAAHTPAIDQLQPQPDAKDAPQPPPDPKLIDAQAKQVKAQSEAQSKQAKIKSEMIKLMAQLDLDNAKVQLMLAQAELARKQAEGVEAGHIIKLLDTQIAAHKAQSDMITDRAKAAFEILQHVESTDPATTAASSTSPAPAAPPTDAAVPPTADATPPQA